MGLGLIHQLDLANGMQAPRTGTPQATRKFCLSVNTLLLALLTLMFITPRSSLGMIIAAAVARDTKEDWRR